MHIREEVNDQHINLLTTHSNLENRSPSYQAVLIYLMQVVPCFKLEARDSLFQPCLCFVKASEHGQCTGTRFIDV